MAQSRAGGSKPDLAGLGLWLGKFRHVAWQVSASGAEPRGGSGGSGTVATHAKRAEPTHGTHPRNPPTDPTYARLDFRSASSAHRHACLQRLTLDYSLCVLVSLPRVTLNGFLVCFKSTVPCPAPLYEKEHCGYQPGVQGRRAPSSGF